MLSSHDGSALLRLIAGDLGGHAGPGLTHTPIVYAHASVAPGARLELPWPPEFNALAYVLSGRGSAGIGRVALHEGQLAIFGPGDAVAITADAQQTSRAPRLEILLLGGRPIRETIAFYGPFVMNTREEIIQAIEDYQHGRLGTIPPTSAHLARINGTDTPHSASADENIPVRTKLVPVALSVILGYTRVMKTAISVPDETFTHAEERAAALGISRSEFFARAAECYLAHLDEESLTGPIDTAIELVGADESNKPAVAAGHRHLARAEDEQLVIERGAVYWVYLGERVGSRPAKRRPVLVVQVRSYNASRLGTTIAVVLTSNTALATMPGNVFLPSVATGLPRDSVANVTAVVTLNKNELDGPTGKVPDGLLRGVKPGTATRSPTLTRGQRRCRRCTETGTTAAMARRLDRNLPVKA